MTAARTKVNHHLRLRLRLLPTNALASKHTRLRSPALLSSPLLSSSPLLHRALSQTPLLSLSGVLCLCLCLGIDKYEVSLSE